nr:hypothetical protein [uncultured Porphyromonas sp.]
MKVTESGIVNELRLEQPENAPSRMAVTEFGIVNEVRLSQQENAE